MVNADIVFRKLHNNEIDDVPIEEGNVIYDLDTKQIFVDDVVDGVLKRIRYGGSEKLIKAIISANTTTKTIYDDTITTDSIIRVYIDENDSFTYNSISTASGSVTITFNAMTQDIPIQIGIGAVSEFHQLITEGQASDISYNNSQSGMIATDVQEAIDELKSDLGNIELTANNVEYDNATSGAVSEDVQGAMDEVFAKIKWYIDNGWLPQIPEGDVPANMEDCSWTMLKSLASAGTLGNYYQIGDTKTIELTGGERVVMELVSINDGEGTAGAYYPRGTVDFISKDCLQTTRSMNSSNTNAGGWVSCALRTTLNTTIYETLPQAVKDVLVEKTHKTSAGSQSTSLVEHTDKLWLPTEYEMFGAITYSANTENANVNKHYAVFDTNADRIKHQGTNGSAVLWWESSPNVSSSSYFCGVSSDGSANDYAVSHSDGVPLCFRIGQS